MNPGTPLAETGRAVYNDSIEHTREPDAGALSGRQAHGQRTTRNAGIDGGIHMKNEQGFSIAVVVVITVNF